MIIMMVPPHFLTPRRSRFSYSLHHHPQQLTKTKKSFCKKECRKRKLSISRIALPLPRPTRPARHALRFFEFILEDALHVHSAITATKKETKKGGKKRGRNLVGRKEEPIQERNPEGEKLKSRIVYCLHCRYISVPAPPDL